MSKQEKVIKNLFIFLDPVIQCTIGLALDHLHFWIMEFVQLYSDPMISLWTWPGYLAE